MREGAGPRCGCGKDGLRCGCGKDGPRCGWTRQDTGNIRRRRAPPKKLS